MIEQNPSVFNFGKFTVIDEEIGKPTIYDI